jgi:hypothetical protein
MNVSFSIQLKLNSSSLVRVVSALYALAHLAHVCGLR